MLKRKYAALFAATFRSPPLGREPYFRLIAGGESFVEAPRAARERG